MPRGTQPVSPRAVGAPQRSSPEMGTHRRSSAMGRCSSTPVPWGCPITLGMELEQGWHCSMAPLPHSLGTFSIFLLLHSQCLPMSTTCSSTPGDFGALIVLLKLTGWLPEPRDAGPCHEPIIPTMSGWVLVWREQGHCQGSSCPAHTSMPGKP